jgi:uncharacterized PurR-regulated membrane protein YhhQ (DUF165 family)
VKLGLAALGGFIATIFAANWAITKYGIVPVGFGLAAPAGVYFVGLAFLFRDLAQRTLGRWPILPAIIVGAGLSYFVADGRIAVASGVAFLASETLDFGVYTLLERRFAVAVVASNVVGAAVDSYLFLVIAFGSTAFLAGQVVGKLWVTVLALPFVLGARKLVRA